MSVEAVHAGVDAALAQIRAGRYDLALPEFQALAAAHPESHTAQHACGAVLSNLAQADRAEPYLRRALALEPANARTRLALGLALLALGKHAEGWALAEARFEVPGVRGKPQIPLAEWRGEPLAGRALVVWPDEGYGDQIQFARFAALLQARGANVVLFCLEPLARLFAQSLPLQVEPVRASNELPAAALWTLASLLPMHLGLRPEAAPPPYLRASEPRAPAGARIGVMTGGNPEHLNDANRSLPKPLAQRLLALPGAISLNPADTGAGDFADTAAIIAGLDLVISADTSVAHLAGAMGKPVWILLPIIGLDWRWGLSGERSAWYPSARLFRQQRIGDWTSVVEAVITAATK